MILTATPEPSAFPPRVRLDLDAEGAEFADVVVLREGRPIRQQPVAAGLSSVHVYDYEAPLGRPVSYVVSGTVIGGSSGTATYTETWSSLSGWVFGQGAGQVGSGRLSATSAATILIATRPMAAPTGAVYQLTLSSRAALGAPADGSTLAVAAVGIGRARLMSRQPGGAFGLDLDGGFIPLSVASTGEIQLTVSPSTGRVSVTHAGVTVERVYNAGTPELYVATLNPTASIGGFTVEVSAPVHATATATTTLDVDEAWLIHPSQPSLSLPIDNPINPQAAIDINVDGATDSERKYTARQSIFQPEGRREAVVFPLGVRSAGAWTLVLNTLTIEARNQLLTILDDQAPLLLRSPNAADWDLPDGWYAIGDVDTERLDGVDGRRRFTMPLTRVAEPPVKIAPDLTWGDLMLRGVTWGELLNHTWLDLLMGEI